MLRLVLERVAATPYSDRVALYMVQLTDPDGLALAERLHAQIPGPDPRILLARAESRGLRVPFMPGAAPVETMARLLDALAAEAEDAVFRAWAVREAHSLGAIPVVIVHEGTTLVTTLGALEEPTAEDVEPAAEWFGPGPVDA